MTQSHWRMWMGVGLLAVLSGGVPCWLASSRAAEPASRSERQVDLGPNADLHGRQLFPPNDPWHEDVSKLPVDPHSKEILATIGLNKPLHPDFGARYQGVPDGIPYVVVPGNQPKVQFEFRYDDSSDRGPYPIPPDAPIEGGPKADGDRHVLILDRDNWKLYELFSVYPPSEGKGWRAGSGAIFDLKKLSPQRPASWTSADAAGLPILPGLIRYDEVFETKEIRHAIRFTVEKSRKGYVYPATHYASAKTDPNLPPMGMRVRLRANYDISRFPHEAQVILKAMKTYGMIVADNGADWFFGGAPDDRWNDDNLHSVNVVKGSDFEVIKMGEVVTK